MIPGSMPGACTPQDQQSDRFAAQVFDQSRFVRPATANGGKGWICNGLGGDQSLTCELQSEPSDTFWCDFDGQDSPAREKSAHRSHQARDMGKHKMFDGPGAGTA